MRTPAGPGVRDDGGVFEGWTVPIDYDPLISKLIVWGSTRDEAICRMQRALGEYRIEGIETNLNFFREVLDHPDFRKGEFDTGFIERWQQNRMADTAPPQTERDLAVIAAILCDSDRTASSPKAGVAPRNSNPWKTTGRMRGMRT